jgi:hypothetical protein
MRLKNLKSQSLIITLALLTVSSVLTGCSSGSSESTEESVAAYFDHSTYMQNLKQNRSNCQLQYISTDREPSYWQSKRSSESEKYLWVEYNDISDYYEFRLEDPSYAEYDAEDVTLTQKCMDFLTSQITELKGYEDKEAVKLIGLYQDLLANRTNFLAQSQAMAALEINKANREKYLEIEGAKRELTDAKEIIFIEIRKVIDFFYYGSVKVFLERCPDAYSIFGNDTVNDGSVLLVNTSSSSAQVDLTARFTDDEDVIVGDWGIYEDVPGNAKIRVEISASGSSGPVTGGVAYPPSCTIN